MQHRRRILMRKTLIVTSVAALIALPGVALAQAGAATGAAAGAVTGGVVGGPVGAAVGAGVGGAVGGAADQQNRNTTGTVVVTPAPSVSEKNTTCVQGSTSSSCTSTEVKR
jgi:hypothetical protein